MTRKNGKTAVCSAAIPEKAGVVLNMVLRIFLRGNRRFMANCGKVTGTSTRIALNTEAGEVHLADLGDAEAYDSYGGGRSQMSTSATRLTRALTPPHQTTPPRRRTAWLASAGRTCHRAGGPIPALTQHRQRTKPARPRCEPEDASHAVRHARQIGRQTFPLRMMFAPEE